MRKRRKTVKEKGGICLEKEKIFFFCGGEEKRRRKKRKIFGEGKSMATWTTELHGEFSAICLFEC